MWLSLFTICLAIAICLGVAATIRAINKHRVSRSRLITLLVKSQEVSMGKLTAEQKVRERQSRTKSRERRTLAFLERALGVPTRILISIMKNAERRSTKAMK